MSRRLGVCGNRGDFTGLMGWILDATLRGLVTDAILVPQEGGGCTLGFEGT